MAGRVFAFVEPEYRRIETTRISLNRALGDAGRQIQARQRVLEDGRLCLDNNLGEGDLRKLVRIRDAIRFAGNDKHAETAAAIFSSIASAKLHNLDPKKQLCDPIRVLPSPVARNHSKLERPHPCYLVEHGRTPNRCRSAAGR